MEASVIIRNGLLSVCFVFLGAIFLLQKQNSRLNWSIFYATLWVSISLAIVNYFCIQFNLWQFSANSMIKMPFDLFFIWIVFWGILPFYVFKGKHFFKITLSLLLLDFLYMPQLDHFGILSLNQYWWIGEFVLIFLVFLPSYYWAKIYYEGKKLNHRALFQVLIMALFFIFCLPFIMKSYGLIEENLHKYEVYLIQIGFIIVLPSLIAVQDLVRIGKGTPFPYDKTNILVRTGVYAYCRNPIQWSFTILFIPLSIYHQSYFLLIGSLVSILYTIGVSNPQEYQDMKIRFGKDWNNYKNNVPNWRFLYKPKNIPNGTIYFKNKCNQCEQIKKWFNKRETNNLTINYSYKYTKYNLLQVTYVDYYGNEYKSIKAIAHALEHINLIYASIGWLMRFPIVYHILQAIIDSMDFEQNEKICEPKNKSL